MGKHDAGDGGGGGGGGHRKVESGQRVSGGAWDGGRREGKARRRGGRIGERRYPPRLALCGMGAVTLHAGPKLLSRSGIGAVGPGESHLIKGLIWIFHEKTVHYRTCKFHLIASQNIWVALNLRAGKKWLALV